MDGGTSETNKFLRENDLLPSKDHTMYSLRHSFQDRILCVNAPDRIQAELIGHKFDRPIMVMAERLNIKGMVEKVMS